MKIGLIGITSLNQEDHFKTIHGALQKQLSGIYSHTESILPISSNYNIKHFHSTSDLFDNSDAIYFAYSLKPNYDFAINALKKSCHLFIEDVSALGIDEIKYLYKVAFEARVKIQLKLTQTFTPEYLEVRNYLSEPKLVEINKSFTKFLRTDDFFSEILNNLYFSHQIIQSGVKKIYTTALPYDNNHLSLVQIRIDYDNGAILNMKLNSIALDFKNTVDIHEKDRIIHVNFDKHYADKHKFTDGQISRTEFSIPNDLAFDTETLNFVRSCQNLDVQNLSDHPAELKIIQLTHEIKNRLIQTTHPI